MTEQMTVTAIPRTEDGDFDISVDVIPLIPTAVINEWYQDCFPELSYRGIDDKIAHIQVLMSTDAENDIKSDFNQHLQRWTYWISHGVIY